MRYLLELSMNNHHANALPANVVYPCFAEAKRQLANIEPIDYFLAKQLSSNIESVNTELLLHVLIFLCASVREGHSCVPISNLAQQHWGVASDELGVVTHQGYRFPALAQLHACLTELALSASAQQPIVFEHGHLYLRRYFSFEHQLAHYLAQRIDGATTITPNQLTQSKHCLELVFPAAQSRELDWQKVAVANALNKNFSVIAGGPGTGKTYTVTKLLAVLALLAQQVKPSTAQLPFNIAMAAPTGKAAQRLAESINKAKQQLQHSLEASVLAAIPSVAKTIHRLLGVIPSTAGFKHDRQNPLACDVLLIDEASMVDLALMTRIFHALKPDCKVILLGDADQLPAVLTGNVLADIAPRPHPGYSRQNQSWLAQLTGFDALPKAKPNQALDYLTILTESRRFDGTGGIGQLAQLVISGQAQASWRLLQHDTETTSCSANQLALVSGSLDTWLAPLVQHYYLPLLTCTEPTQAFALINKFRLLCVTKQGNTGVEHYNALVKKLLVALGASQCQQEFYHGQPIMIAENHYGLGLYNGDLGFIWRADSGQLMAIFEDPEQGVQAIMLSRLPNFQTVYAMTIHKSQGSEFDHVVMILPERSDHPLLSRQLLYTGLTRAKQKFTAYSKQNVWLQAVEQQVVRYSQLPKQLADIIDQTR
jgi:exodeoxyribonuclease V alpha subunit